LIRQQVNIFKYDSIDETFLYKDYFD